MQQLPPKPFAHCEQEFRARAPPRYRTTTFKRVEIVKLRKRIEEFLALRAAIQGSNPRLRTGAHLNASINNSNPPKRM